MIWNLYKCKICQFWIYGDNNEDKIFVLMNNLYNFESNTEKKKKLIRSKHLKELKLSKLL